MRDNLSIFKEGAFRQEVAAACEPELKSWGSVQERRLNIAERVLENISHSGTVQVSAARLAYVMGRFGEPDESDAYRFVSARFHVCRHPYDEIEKPHVRWGVPTSNLRILERCRNHWTEAQRDELAIGAQISELREKLLARAPHADTLTEGTLSHSQGTSEGHGFSERLQELLALKPGWDGEDAVAPSEVAVHAARLVIGRLPPDLRIHEVDADVIGGLTIWIQTPTTSCEDRWVWFSVRNSGKILLVLSVQRPGGALSISAVENPAAAYEKARAFLSEERNETKC